MQTVQCEPLAVPRVSLDDLARVFFGKDHTKGVFCMLAFYMAYSADEKDKSVYAIAGLMTDTSQFLEIERQWGARLERDGLPYFRPYECKSLDGEFVKLIDK